MQTPLDAHQRRVGVLCQRTAYVSAVRVSCHKRMLPPQPGPGRAALLRYSWVLGPVTQAHLNLSEVAAPRLSAQAERALLASCRTLVSEFR